MSTLEITTPEDRTERITPPPAAPVATNGKIKVAKRRPDDPEEPVAEIEPEVHPRRGEPLSAEMKEVRRTEDMAVKEIIDSFGTGGVFKCRITRKEPDSWRDASGKLITGLAGFLCWTSKAFDEEWLKDKYGGGTYELHFKKHGPKGGWIYGAQRDVTIGGAPPNLDEMALPASAVTPAATTENPSLVKDMLAMAQKQVDKADERAAHAERTGVGANDPMLEFLRDQAKANQQMIADLQRELREAVTRVPPKSTEDTVKDKLLDKLMDQDTARLQAVRAQYESELRMAKEAAYENEKRLRDMFERDKQDMRNAHERELALVRTSTETILASAKANYETSLMAAKSSFDTQKEIMKAENNRLDRENGEQRIEVKDLRAKKEKGIVEQFKDIQAVKEAMGIEDGESGGIGEKILDGLTNPDVITAAGKLFRGQDATPPPAAPAPEPIKPRVIRDASGNRFVLGPDGKIRPVKPKTGPGSAQEPGVPFIEPALVEQVVGYLERAFTAGTDPEIVAQSGKASVPEPVLTAIRDMGGVDVFLAKVAKLPSSSPLSSSQAGRNWARKVGKALVGE